MNAIETGKKIKQLRKEKGLKQSDLAKALNVSDKLISKWETGISIPSTEFTFELCKFFEIDVNEFLGLASTSKLATTKKPLSPKIRLSLFIAGGIFAFYILFSLIYFVIIPFSCKTMWLNDINVHLQNVLDRGYYSFEMSSTVDGKTTTQKENAKIQDGILYYERFMKKEFPTSVIVGNVEYDGMHNYIPFDQANKNLSDIFCHADKDDQTAKFIENMDAKYILRTAKGYKMSVKGFSVSGATLQGKVIADIIFDGEYFKELNLYFTLKQEGKVYDCKGSVIFDLDAPPQNIKMYEKSYVQWKVPSLSLSECTEEQLGGKITTTTITDSGNIISAGNNLVFYDNSSIRIYDGKTLTLKNQFEIQSDIFTNYIKRVYATETHLYATLAVRENDILKIDLSNGAEEIIHIPDQNELLQTNAYEYIYVLPNGNIYYDVYQFGTNVEYPHLTRNQATGNYILGEVFHFDGTHVYTILNENLTNLIIRKYDLNDNLITEYTNLSINCSDNFVGQDGEKFYFSRACADENFNTITDYLRINLFSPEVFAKHENVLYSNLGIFYTDKFKPPIAISDILNGFELKDYIIYKGEKNCYYSIAK